MVTREDLSPARQAVQGMHAACHYTAKHPGAAEGYLIFLSAEDEKELSLLLEKLGWYDIETVEFHEPDLDNELTAIAASGPRAARRLSHLPLALKGGESNV